MSLRWAKTGPDARRRTKATQGKESLRSDNDADGPVLAHPKGDTLFARPRRRSSSATRSIESPRRRFLMAGENRVVAGSLGSEIDSQAKSVPRPCEWVDPSDFFHFWPRSGGPPMPPVKAIVPDVASRQRISLPALFLNYLSQLMLPSGNNYCPTTSPAYPTASVGGRGDTSASIWQLLAWRNSRLWAAPNSRQAASIAAMAPPPQAL